MIKQNSTVLEGYKEKRDFLKAVSNMSNEEKKYQEERFQEKCKELDDIINSKSLSQKRIFIQFKK